MDYDQNAVEAARRYLSTILPPDPVRDAFSRLRHNLELNSSFSELIQQKQNAVRNFLENNGLPKETLLIGSLQRETRIQPLPGETFDIDILVPLGSFYSWLPATLGISTYDALGKIQGALQQSDRYGQMAPKQDQPTVTFEYSEGKVKVELVPAYLDQVGISQTGVQHYPVGRGYWVPKTGMLWELADYMYDAAHITDQNKQSDGWLVPTIKMLKAIKRKYLADYLTSYHLEVLAAQVIPIRVKVGRAMGVTITYPYLIESFFIDAQELILGPIRMPGSNSPFVSAKYPYTLKEKMGTIAQYCAGIKTRNTADEQLTAWKQLFADPFTLTDNT